MSSEELTKEEFMVACKADGTEESVCAARWEAAHAANPTVPPASQSSASTGPPVMGDLLREIEMLKTQVEIREKQLRQAIDIAGRANSERKAREDAEKERLINSIVLDSKFGKDELDKKSLGDLQTIRTTLDKSIEKTFASVAADLAEAQRKKKPHLTAGYYDSATKTWKGGI